MKFKNIFFLLLVIFIISCNSKRYDNKFIGSWYAFNQKTDQYIEIHIDDSLYLLTGGQADIVITYSYHIKKDSILLDPIQDRTPIKYLVYNDNKLEKLALINNLDTLLLTRMNTTVENLVNYFENDEMLDSFSRGVCKRLDEKIFESRHIIKSKPFICSYSLYKKDSTIIGSVFLRLINDSIFTDLKVIEQEDEIYIIENTNLI